MKDIQVISNPHLHKEYVAELIKKHKSERTEEDFMHNIWPLGDGFYMTEEFLVNVIGIDPTKI